MHSMSSVNGPEGIESFVRLPDWIVLNFEVKGDAILASPSFTIVLSVSSISFSIFSMRATFCNA